MNSIIENPVLKKLHSDIRSRLRQKFPDLAKCGHDNILLLHKYMDISPGMFFTEDIYNQMLSWLTVRDNKIRRELQRYFNEYSTSISQALMHLDEINALPWYDDSLPNSDIEQIRFIDQSVHPVYLRLVEGVLAKLLHPVAYFNRKDRGKGTDGLDVWNIVEELKDGSLGGATIGYNNTIRNGIAHGGITYLNREIKYQDNRGNEEIINNSAMIRIYDDLLDICNALSLSISVFLLIRKSDGYELPQYMFYEELRAKTNTPYWKVDTCIPSQSLRGNQLIIYVQTKTRDYRKVWYSSLQTGILAGILAPGYKRYFVSIQSEKALPGWAAFNGAKIASIVGQGDFTMRDCVDALEDGLIFYIPKPKLPRILGIISTYYITAKIVFPLVVSEVRKEISQTTIKVRNVSIHKNGWRIVLGGQIVVHSTKGLIDQEDIYKSLRRITKKVTRKARREKPYWSLLRYLPLGFLDVSVFRRNYRKRRLSSFGLGSDLICKIRIHRIKRIKSPFIFGSTLEKRGKYIIAWNKHWLEDDKVKTQQSHDLK